MIYEVRLAPTAEADLRDIFNYISEQASPLRARSYIDRIRGYLASFDVFPERGTVRDDIRAGLHVVGFERRVSVAFVIEDNRVVVLRVLYAGRQMELP